MQRGTPSFSAKTGRHEDVYEKVKNEVGNVDILIQCAGVVTSNRTFDKNTVKDIDKTMTINAVAPMYVAHAMLPDMIARDHGHICNTHSKVRFTTVTPYFINTGMFDGVSSKIFPILDPVKTSAKIIRAIEKNRDFKGIPFGFHFTRFCQGILPKPLFDWLFGDVFGIYHAMDHFIGRK